MYLTKAEWAIPATALANARWMSASSEGASAD